MLNFNTTIYTILMICHSLIHFGDGYIHQKEEGEINSRLELPRLNFLSVIETIITNEMATVKFCMFDVMYGAWYDTP